MREFFAHDEMALETLSYQISKVENRDFRYAKRVLKEYGSNYIECGLARAKEIQHNYTV